MKSNVIELPTRGPRPLKLVWGEDEFDVLVQECEVYLDRVQLVVTLATEDAESRKKFARVITNTVFPRPLP